MSDEPLTEADVRLAYHLILGRAPENDEVVRHALGYGTLAKLRAAFLNSLEFEQILVLRPRLVRADAPPLDVLSDANDATTKKLLSAVAAAWDRAPPTSGDGAPMAADLAATLLRNGLALPEGAAGFDFGCGAGRITRHLAGRVRTLTAADASRTQLAMAGKLGLANVTLVHASDTNLGMGEEFHLWYSYHALQHSPPPLIARVLARAFALLRPGGVAMFQLPTYAYGYSYTAQDLARPTSGPGDRHVLPQPIVLRIAAAHGCEPVELIEDLSIGPNALWRSTLFVLRKRGA